MKPLVVSAFPRYSIRGPSSRVRFYQYSDHLQRHNIDIKYYEFHSSTGNYLDSVFGNSPKQFLTLLNSYVNRICCMFNQRHADCFWVQGDFLPYIPWKIELIVLRIVAPKKIIVDYDDAIYLRYQKNKFLSLLLGSKHVKLSRFSEKTVVGNTVLADYFSTNGAFSVSYVPSTFDLTCDASTESTLHSISKLYDNNPILIGWIGTPNTQKNLHPYIDFFHDFQSKFNARFCFMGVSKEFEEKTQFICLDWSPANEPSFLKMIDIGIMPLLSTNYANAKCGYKLLQYMANKKPCVCTPLGINKSIVLHNITGFHAHDFIDWYHFLSILCSSQHQRAKFGEQGFIRYSQYFTPEFASHLLANHFYNL
jgi:glycosyltransferase involved in cell wall biosynthesis